MIYEDNTQKYNFFTIEQAKVHGNPAAPRTNYTFSCITICIWQNFSVPMTHQIQGFTEHLDSVAFQNTQNIVM